MIAIKKYYRVIHFMAVALLVTLPSFAIAKDNSANDDWLIGKWQLHFDPDGSKTDFVEFKADGDAISSGPNGEFEGLYIVSPDSVKAVFTYKEKDFIMTFHFNDARDELRIVTSHTGRESIYKKIN
jgi:hypothetical protein